MPDVRLEKEALIHFFEGFQDEDGATKYFDLLQAICNRQRTVLIVELDDLAQYMKLMPSGDDTKEVLLEEVETNTKHYLKQIAEAADEILATMEPTINNIEIDVYDVLLQQRLKGINQAESRTAADGMGRQKDPSHHLPAALMRRFEVQLHPRTDVKPLRMRQVQSDVMGSLVTVRGIVTNATDVKPLLTVATYLDSTSGLEVYQDIVGRTFLPLEAPPPTAAGMQSSKDAELVMQTRGSKFVKYQEVRIQELASEVPQGTTPRSMVLHVTGELTRLMRPGDPVTVSGIFLPEPFTGFRAAKAGLLTSTFLLVQRVLSDKQSYNAISMDVGHDAAIQALVDEGDLYNRLARSIAPEIWGHEDVKKALLLVLVGGVSKEVDDGMRLRGDIHACLMGDPGVAKSQLLRFVCNISPRAVYTTGKGSSGVGLTAAVTRDSMTGEMTLEGGALVLADKGICAIDEFDKMEESDRTAIHEVMEQQTVSIAKAGITTTLNTRTTVLAAANPAWGRYDTRRSPSENIALPAALLSRFDLLWLILDRADDTMDRALAQHVLSVHKYGKAPVIEGAASALTADQLRAYIAHAKQRAPFVPESLTEYFAAVYAEMRAEEAQTEQPHSYTTARTLLSMLRLSQALARLRLADSVAQPDVDEALRLMRMSKISLSDNESGTGQKDVISTIYSRIRDNAQEQRKDQYAWAEILAVAGNEFKHEEIRACLTEYADINIWQVEKSAAGEDTISFLESARPYAV